MKLKRFGRQLGANHVDIGDGEEATTLYKTIRAKRSIERYAKVIDSLRSSRNNGHEDRTYTPRPSIPLFRSRPILSLPSCHDLDLVDRDTIRQSAKVGVMLLRVGSEMTDIIVHPCTIIDVRTLSRGSSAPDLEAEQVER